MAVTIPAKLEIESDKWCVAHLVLDSPCASSERKKLKYALRGLLPSAEDCVIIPELGHIYCSAPAKEVKCVEQQKLPTTSYEIRSLSVLLPCGESALKPFGYFAGKVTPLDALTLFSGQFNTLRKEHKMVRRSGRDDHSSLRLSLLREMRHRVLGLAVKNLHRFQAPSDIPFVVPTDDNSGFRLVWLSSFVLTFDLGHHPDGTTDEAKFRFDSKSETREGPLHELCDADFEHFLNFLPAYTTHPVAYLFSTETEPPGGATSKVSDEESSA